MKAQELFAGSYQGESLPPAESVVGLRAKHDLGMICVCPGGGDDCEE